MRKDYPAVALERVGETCSRRKDIVRLEPETVGREMQFSIGVGNGLMKVVELELDIFGELLHTQIYVKDCSATLDDIVPVARAISSRVVQLVRRQAAQRGNEPLLYIPGTAFGGKKYERFIRLSACAPYEEIQRACNKLNEICLSKKKS